MWVLKENGQNLELFSTHHAYKYGFQEEDQPIRVWPIDAGPAMVAKEAVDFILQPVGATERSQPA
jgi:hypothetical protein